ncbi:MAG: pyruvate kinase [Methylococcaceae bacterium]|nr:pyruvate kinase [Methylococcaceae bacterium]
MKDYPDSSNAELKELLQELRQLRGQVIARATRRLGDFVGYFDGDNFNSSAWNLAHYLALRQFDLRRLQERLARVGLSSLGRSESGVLANLDAVISLLVRALGETETEGFIPYGDYGKLLLEKHTEAIFGPMDGERQVRIMVTLPGEAGKDYKLVKNLIHVGANCIRINCAHDDKNVWEAMIRHVRKASEENRKHCLILMDLGGHKLRTGPLAAAPKVFHAKPRRDEYGRIIAPAEIPLYSASCKKTLKDNELRLIVANNFFRRLAAGDSIVLTDSRGKSRTLTLIKRIGNDGWLSHCKTGSVYLNEGITLDLLHGNGQKGDEATLALEGSLPLEIKIQEKEALLLSFGDEPGYPARREDKSPARIGCGVAAIKDWLQPGDPVWFDDGKIGAVVEKIRRDGALLRITHAKNAGSRLLSDKGINFPKTRMQLPPLSEKDLQDLDFVCRHADMVGFSFVETLADLEFMRSQLAQRGASQIPIIAKIESDRAVRNLPELILGCIGRHKLGIMIARGDLAVELGSVRLAEIQEEILWVCEAAHVPVIWATQVLESMTKKGEPSRPEFTDAAMSVRAECVMLNKGSYIVRTVEVLADVLSRMQAHQRKKFSRLRALHW